MRLDGLQGRYASSWVPKYEGGQNKRNDRPSGDAQYIGADTLEEGDIISEAVARIFCVARLENVAKIARVLAQFNHARRAHFEIYIMVIK